MKKILVFALVLFGMANALEARDKEKLVWEVKDGFYYALNGAGVVYNEISIGCDIKEVIGFSVNFQTAMTGDYNSWGVSGAIYAQPRDPGRFTCEPYLKLGAEKGIYGSPYGKIQGMVSMGASLLYEIYNGFKWGFDASVVCAGKTGLLPVLGINFSYEF